MKVDFETRDPDASRLREFVVRRASFVMRRLTWLVPTARVLLDDVNGPRGGVDKRCQVELRLRKSGRVVVTALGRDWHAALDQALDRAANTALRHWKRGGHLRRRRPGPVLAGTA